METVYKLVNEIGKRLVSVGTCGKAQVTYELKKWAKLPKFLEKEGHRFCVFVDKRKALTIQRERERDSILIECKAKNDTVLRRARL